MTIIKLNDQTEKQLQRLKNIVFAHHSNKGTAEFVINDYENRLREIQNLKDELYLERMQKIRTA